MAQPLCPADIVILNALQKMTEKSSYHCSCGKTFRTQSVAIKHLEDNQAYTSKKVGHEIQGYFHGEPPTVNMHKFPRE